jgi:hypothetical protein
MRARTPRAAAAAGFATEASPKSTCITWGENKVVDADASKTDTSGGGPRGNVNKYVAVALCFVALALGGFFLSLLDAPKAPPPPPPRFGGPRSGGQGRTDIKLQIPDKTTCFTRGRGACQDVGLAKKIPSAATCQVQCLAYADCKFFSYDDRTQYCALCSTGEDDGEACVGASCVYGPKRCRNEPAPSLRGVRVRSRAVASGAATPLEIAEAAVTTARAICDGVDLEAFNTLQTAAEFSALVKKVRDKQVAGYEADHDAFLAAVETHAATAVAILGDESCAPSACNVGLTLFATLEAFLIVVDGHAGRAHVGDPVRQALFDKHKIFFADAKFLSDYTVARVEKFVEGLPTHLIERGVRAYSPFTTVQVKNAFHCNSELSGASQFLIPTVTVRAFNLHNVQSGAWKEEAFSNTPVAGTGGTKGDIFQTILRHEAAHQFDRTMNNRQLQLRVRLTAASTEIRDWPRAGVNSRNGGAAAFFRSATGEIIASHVGNQYLLSTSSQLELGRLKAVEGDLKPLAWFLFDLDIVGAATTATFYENEKDNGIVDTYEVMIERKPGLGAVTRLRVPGCGEWTFSYDDLGMLTGYTWDRTSLGRCIPTAGVELEAYPTLEPTPAPTFAPSPHPGPQFPPCGVKLYKGTINENKPTEVMRCMTTAWHTQKEVRYGCCDKTTNVCKRNAIPIRPDATLDKDLDCFHKEDGKWAAHNWYEAFKMCEDAGLKLCDVPSAGPCHGDGCQLNDEQLWTNIPCEPGDPGYDATCEAQPSPHPTAQPTEELPPDEDPTHLDLEEDPGLDIHWPPTPQPVAAPAACEDDTDWRKNGDSSRDCNWVGKSTGVRCVKEAVEKCCACAPLADDDDDCSDSGTFLKNDIPGKGCAWVSQNKDVRCAHEKSRVECCATCTAAPPADDDDGCTDSGTFLKNDLPGKSCVWVSLYPDIRCTHEKSKVACCATCTGHG